MNTILIVFFILIFLMLIIAFPFKTRMMLHVDLITLKSFYSLKIYKFKMLCGKAEIVDGSIKILNSNNILKGDVDKKFLIMYLKEIADVIDIKKIELFFEGGFVDDSYLSAIMCGAVTSSVRVVYSVLSQKYNNVKLFENVTPTFYDTNLELTFDGVVAISIFKMLIALIKSLKILKKKEVYNEN